MKFTTLIALLGSSQAVQIKAPVGTATGTYPAGAPENTAAAAYPAGAPETATTTGMP